MTHETIGDKLELLKQLYAVIHEAAGLAGRSADSVRLIGVSKRKPVEMIRAYRRAGLRDFGENYVQEFLEKYEQLQDADIQWHFIGHLQRNKVKYLIDKVAWIHTVDSVALAQEIQKQAEKKDISSVRCLIQVNIGKEPQKSGVLPEDLPSVLRGISDLDRVSIRGLMAIPPFLEPEELRPYHRELFRLFTEIAPMAGEQCTELSMGMSNDFDVAIEEGATMVRVGTLLFGERL